MIAFTKERASVWSYIVKLLLKPNLSASALRIREKTEWNVPIWRYRARSSPTSRPMRSFISRAALLVNVSASICQGFSPCSNRYAIL